MVLHCLCLATHACSAACWSSRTTSRQSAHAPSAGPASSQVGGAGGRAGRGWWLVAGQPPGWVGQAASVCLKMPVKMLASDHSVCALLTCMLSCPVLGCAEGTWPEICRRYLLSTRAGKAAAGSPGAARRQASHPLAPGWQACPAPWHWLEALKAGPCQVVTGKSLPAHLPHSHPLAPRTHPPAASGAAAEDVIGMDEDQAALHLAHLLESTPWHGLPSTALLRLLNILCYDIAQASIDGWDGICDGGAGCLGGGAVRVGHATGSRQHGGGRRITSLFDDAWA
jgi:hypothetical protein